MIDRSTKYRIIRQLILRRPSVALFVVGCFLAATAFLLVVTAAKYSLPAGDIKTRDSIKTATAEVRVPGAGMAIIGGSGIAGSVVQTPKLTPPDSFTLSAVGDINCGGTVGKIIAGNGVDYPFKNVAGILSSTDIAIGNLECALSARGKAVAGKKFTFRGSPQCGPALKRAGFDLISLANNHSKDFGAEAAVDTTKILSQAGVIYAGGGSNSISAYQPGIIQVSKASGKAGASAKKIGFLAFSDVVPPGFVATSKTPGVASVRDSKRVAGAIKDARAKADFVIVSIHWGKELSTSPSARQILLAHQLIDSGVDMVIGHHPHVVQGFESYKGKLVAYSLGNFVFSPANNLGRQSALLTAVVEDGKVVSAHVYPVYIEGVRPKIISGKKGDSWLREIERRSRGFKTHCQIGTIRGQAMMKIRVLP